ncbi:MAG TPA: alpha/beta fold hydrolase [Chitinophaga sp.]|uniref:thioesterase II family protein n=1 Tax=Chitinophaga sp. TaxID=1869181 RepID=UPI002D08B454|nr:alpha/beta fold hydrolase [Chitinophaga sp.]HVI46036.1 alpha/beta fold hydrolase [Chitinophaga sp.]
MIHKTKLVCIPYAGGNSYSYRGLKPFLDSKIELLTVELPGRGARITAPLLSDLEHMADDIYQQILPHTDGPWILYGHSMGALIGNLVMHRLHAEERPLPLHFFVTGCESPFHNDQRTHLHPLSDTDLKSELKKLGGLPDEILGNNELMDYFLPVIREDMKALELWKYKSPGRFPTAVTVITGTEDLVTEEQVLGWEKETVQGIRKLRYPGNHFFILRHFGKLASLVHHEALLSSYA